MRIIKIIYYLFFILPIYGSGDSLFTKPGSDRITISIVGDVMVHQTQLNWAKQSNGNYDFNPVFSYIKEYIQQSDFAIANFETVCAGDKYPYNGYPVFNTPDTIIGTLKDAGFDLLLTANNHILDMGIESAKRTMREIHKRGLFYNGSNQTQDEQDSIKIYSTGGINFAFLAYSYSSNLNNTNNTKYLLNRIDSTRIWNDIRKARSKDVDLVIVNFHFGAEELREPDKYQRKVVRNAIAAGADIILGGHPHRLQPIELFKTNAALLDTGFVVYSMGNFVSNQRWRYNDGGAILNFTLKRDSFSKKVILEEVNYIPIWVFKGMSERGREYIIFPSEMAVMEKLPEFFTTKDEELMLQSYQDCIETFQLYSDFPRIKNLFRRGNTTP